MKGCCANPSSLCERCATDYFNCLRGTAANRGERWARIIANRYPAIRGVPWPRTAKARHMAIERVADLTSDPQLRSRLADELERYAMRAWHELAEFMP